jgi:hypothetical protein
MKSTRGPVKRSEFGRSYNKQQAYRNNNIINKDPAKNIISHQETSLPTLFLFLFLKSETKSLYDSKQ